MRNLPNARGFLFRPCFPVITAAALLAAAGGAGAQSNYVLQPSLPSSGWNTSTDAVWGLSTGGNPLGSPNTSFWPDGNIAVIGFGGIAQTLTVSGQVSANGITSLTSGSTVTGTALSLSGANAFLNNQNSGNTLTVSAPLSGSTGLIVFNSAGGIITLSGLSTYTGDTNARSGSTLKAGVSSSGGAGAFGSVNNGLAVFSGTTADLNGFNVGAGSLYQDGTITNSSATAATLTIGNGNAGTTNNPIDTGGFAGAITGNLALTKVGGGTVTLATPHTYTGATTLSEGTLVLAVSGALPAASALTLDGGRLSLADGTTSVTGGRLTLSESSTLDFGPFGSATSLTFADSSASLWNGSLLTVSGWNGSLTGGGPDQLFVGSGGSGLTAAQLAKISFTGYEPGAKFITGTGEVVPLAAIPEPSASACLAAGAVLLASRRRGHRRRVA